MHNAVYAFTPGSVVRRDRDNPAIGLMELTQLVAGVFDIDSIARVAPNAKLELFTGQSAYGPRVGHQLEGVVQELLNDPDSRRAVMMVAGLNETPETMPCTLSIQFQLVPISRSLITTVTMRSSDVIWGLPYDMTQFGGVAMVVASCLSAIVQPFSCTVNIANGHVYDKTRPVHANFDDAWKFSVPEFTSVYEYRAWAMLLLDSRPTREDIEQAFNLRRDDEG